jgi:transcriptional regulator GlxA family with amidase domain
MLETGDDLERIIRVEAFLRDRGPLNRDGYIALLNEVIDRIAVDRTITRVGGAADYLGVSQRHLERLFRLYVGVSPKWVIRRYRLFEATERLETDPRMDVAMLATELGYFDQSHFIRDFTAMIGTSPTKYAQQAS